MRQSNLLVDSALRAFVFRRLFIADLARSIHLEVGLLVMNLLKLR